MNYQHAITIAFLQGVPYLYISINNISIKRKNYSPDDTIMNP